MGHFYGALCISFSPTIVHYLSAPMTLAPLFVWNTLTTHDKTGKKKNVDPSTHYDLVGKLGEGAFGDVWKAKNRITQKYAAAKIIETGSEAEIEEHYGEIEILMKCNHQESQ